MLNAKFARPDLKDLSFRWDGNHFDHCFIIDRTVHMGESIFNRRRPFIYEPAGQFIGVYYQFDQAGGVFEITLHYAFYLVGLTAMNKPLRS